MNTLIHLRNKTAKEYLDMEYGGYTEYIVYPYFFIYQECTFSSAMSGFNSVS